MCECANGLDENLAPLPVLNSFEYNKYERSSSYKTDTHMHAGAVGWRLTNRFGFQEIACRTIADRPRTVQNVRAGTRVRDKLNQATYLHDELLSVTCAFPLH